MSIGISQYQELDGPIVLLIGNKSAGAGRLLDRLYYDFTVEANGQTVEFIHVRIESYWWDDPGLHDKMHELLDLFPRKSKMTAMKWIETEGFVREVRKILARTVEDCANLEELPPNWPELVSLVVLDVDTETDYTRRVFDGWFPNAKFRANCGQGETKPIWRDAEIIKLDPDAAKWPPPELLELLSRRCDQLGLMPPQIGSKLANAGLTTVAHLVRTGGDQVRAILGGDDAHYKVVGNWLGEHNLKLGMTDADLEKLTIKAQAKPTKAEVLDWPINQLLGLPSEVSNPLRRLAAADRVQNLVCLQLRALISAGVSDFVITKAEEALARYGLRLGMTSAEIAEIKASSEAQPGALAAAAAVINSDIGHVLILGPRLSRAIERLGIRTIKELVVKTHIDLARGLGSTDLTDQVQAELEKHHLSLGMDELAVVAVLEMAEAS